jgi:hypothetical protein
MAIIAFAFALIFCAVMVWHSREVISANLLEMRTKLHDIGGSQQNALPEYTATPVSKNDLQRRAAVVAPPPPKPPMEVTVVRTEPAPKPSGPNTMSGVVISPAPPTPNVIPVRIDNGATAPAPAASAQ